MYAIADYRNRGCASSFYTMKGSRKRGFKTFHDKYSADIAHRHQSFLAKYDLAPKVYSEVGKIRTHGKHLSNWGYVTEIAQTIGCGGNTCECGECDHEALECEHEDMISNLVNDIEDVGYYFGDCHIGNVGYVKRNGRKVLVCIDTGDESLTETDGPCTCMVCRNGGDCQDE